MRIHSISVRNYRPFKVLEEVRLGQLATIVGKNDAGKSSVLRALQLFLDKKPKIELDDVHEGATPNEDILVEVSFTSLPPKIQIEEGVDTTFKDEMLLDSESNLRIKKIFSRDDKTVRIILVSENFQDPHFADLVTLKEAEYNRRCKEKGIDATKSGRGITNKDKRIALRDFASKSGVNIGKYELELSPRDDLWKAIESLLPDFDLFESEHRTDVEDTSFQREFRPIIETTANNPDVTKAKDEFTGSIEAALQAEVNKIFEKLKKYTDDITALTAKPIFSWDKAVALQISGKDRYGVDKPLEKRGSGIRRLLMVAFFEHLADKREEKKANLIFGLEEPENNLHPGLQRDLVQSFRQLADQGYQIILTTHSPVFAGASPLEDLTLIVREGGVAKASQSPQLSLADVAEELGVEPSDQIIGYKACVFVEGSDDIFFWKTVASKLKEGRAISSDFEDKGIGLIPVGGVSNLKWWMNMSALKKLSQLFAVVVDSDKKSPSDSLHQRVLNWKSKCECEGGIFVCCQKHSIENYLHPKAIERSGRPLQQYDGFTHMKDLFGDNVFKVIKDMSAAEILEMDTYEENGNEHHELKEIVEKLLELVK